MTNLTTQLVQKKRAQVKAGIAPLPEPLKTRPRTLPPCEPLSEYSPTQSPTQSPKKNAAPYDPASPEYNPETSEASKRQDEESYDELSEDESPSNDSKKDDSKKDNPEPPKSPALPATVAMSEHDLNYKSN